MTDRDARYARAALERAIAHDAEEGDHLSYEQLEAYVDGRAGGDDVEREVVESHLASCAVCGEDLSDLMRTRAEIVPAGRPRRPAFVKWVVGAAAAAALFVALAWWGRLGSTSTTLATTASTVAAAPTPSVFRADERAAIDAALLSRRIAVPELVRALFGAEGTLLGAAPRTAQIRLVAPVGTAVSATKPEFSWSSLRGATSYKVVVTDDSFQEVAASGPLTATTWTPPSELPRGRVLTWQVTGRLADGSTVIAPALPHPEARLMVLDEPGAAAVEEQRVRLSGHPLELGILLAKAGLVAEAERELTRAAADASTAVDANRLLATLRR